MTLHGLIEYGSDKPTSFFTSESNMALVRAAPITGTVIRAVLANGTQLSTRIFSSVSHRKEELAQAYRDLARAAPLWGDCNQNFIKVQISAPTGTPQIDPFDRVAIQTVIDNYLLAGKLAAESGCGIFFDAEPYIHPIWTYDAQPLRDEHTIEEYERRWYEVGLEIGSGWAAMSDDFRVFLTESYYGIIERGEPWAANEWYLYGYFLDGLLDAFGSKGPAFHGKIITTTEASYGCQTEGCINWGAVRINGTHSAPYRGRSEYFLTHLRESGLALWLNKPTFDPATPSANYFTPELFKGMLECVRDSGLQWAWVYYPERSYFSELPSLYADKIHEFLNGE